MAGMSSSTYTEESNPALADELEKAITGEVLIEAKDIFILRY